jgi:hypothetical protein
MGPMQVVAYSLQQAAARPKHRTHLYAFRCWRSISTGWARRHALLLIYRIFSQRTRLNRWALVPKSDDGRGAARCRASVDVRFPKNHARGGNGEVRSFDIVVDTFAGGETVS